MINKQEFAKIVKQHLLDIFNGKITPICCRGLCSELRFLSMKHNFVWDGFLLRYLMPLFKSWPEYSGSEIFPVPGYEFTRNDPRIAYTRCMMGDSNAMWDRSHPYGYARLQLCLYIANNIEQVVNEREVHIHMNENELREHLKNHLLALSGSKILPKYPSFGVCSEIRLFLKNENFCFEPTMGSLTTLFHEWDEFSGDGLYPVKDCANDFKGDPTEVFNQSCGVDMWNPGHLYGASRLRLCQFIADNIDKLVLVKEDEGDYEY